MSGVQMLVRTPSPYPSESLFGYALRVSEENGYTTPWYVLTYAGLSHGELRTAGFPVEKLAKVLGKSLGDLQPIAHCEIMPDGRKRFKILGHALGGGLSTTPLRLNHPAFCPQCVREDGYLDAFWDLTLAVVCPIHRVHVLRACPSCGEPLNKFRLGILRCKCGGALSNSVSIEESNSLCELMKVLRGVLHRAWITPESLACGLPISELQNIPFASLLKGLPSLGAYALTVENRASDAKNPLETMRRTAEILTLWPANFHKFLNELGSAPGFKKNNTLGFRAQFEDFYEAIFKGRGWCKDFEFLREEFVNFGESVWGQAVVDKKMRRRPSEIPSSAARFMTLSTLARIKGVRPITLRRWEERGLLSLTKVKVGAQTRYIADAANLNVSAHHPGQVFGEREAAAYVKFPVSVLRALRVSGHYQTHHIPEHKPQYHQKDLDAFLRRLFERVPLAGDSQSGPYLSLGRIFLQGKSLAVAGKAAFVGKFLDGKVVAIGRIGDSSHDIQFARGDVETHFKTARLVAAKGCLTAAQACTLIDCDPVAIRPLTEGGYLVVRKRLNRFALCEKSVRLFAARFIALSSLANRLQTSATALSRICDDNGIGLTRVARSAGATVAFAKRSDSEKISYCVAVKKKRHVLPPSCIERVQKYLLDLAVSGEQIPLIGTRINKSQIAKVCKVDRKTLSDNKAALELIGAFFKSRTC